jgi:hypothetical protein
MNSIDRYSSIVGVSENQNNLRQSEFLSDEQKRRVQTILSKFDPNNVTVQDAQNIYKQMMAAGINPGKDLRDSIRAAGFNPQWLQSLAAKEPQESQNLTAATIGEQLNNYGDDQGIFLANGVNTSALQTLQTILNQYDLENMNSDEEKSLMESLNQAGLLKSGDMINIRT